MAETLTSTFFQLLCEKNSDGTKKLRLKEKELWQRKAKRTKETIFAFPIANCHIVNLDLCFNNVAVTLTKQYRSSDENSLEYLRCILRPMAMKCLYALKLKKILIVTEFKIAIEEGKYLGMIFDLDCDEMPFLICAKRRQDIGSNKTLKILDASRMLPSDPYHVSKLLGNMIELHIQKCEIDGHDVELLLMGMPANTSLMLLDLGYNKIGDHGLELLARWLRARPGLLGLNVAGNGIEDTGAKALSLHLPFTKLQLLDISKNRISDEGILGVLHTIKKPYALRLLYIWGNQMTKRTFKVIDRMVLYGMLQQENIDVKLCKVDGVLRHAFYPSDQYKQRYYSVANYGCPIELRFKRNKVVREHARLRHLVKFQFYPRVPAAKISVDS